MKGQNLACRLACIARTSAVEVVTLERYHSDFSLLHGSMKGVTFMDFVCRAVCERGFSLRAMKAANGAEVHVLSA